MTTYLVKYANGSNLLITTATLGLTYDPTRPVEFTGYLHAGLDLQAVDVDLQNTVAHAIVEIAKVGASASAHTSTVTVAAAPAVRSRLKWVGTGTTAILDVEPHVDPVDLDLTGGDRTPKPVKVHITRPLIAS